MSIPLRVLILEDRAADAELMVEALHEAGFAPEWRRVETEADYLAQLDPPPDVILADWSLPQFDAPRALRLLQDRGLDVPFIVVSGVISEDVAVACIKEGAADYLLKDRLGRLGPAVAHALDQSRLRRDKQQAEAALRESEERYRLITESINDAIFLVDLEGRLRFASRRGAEMTGYGDELLGQPLFALLTPEGAEGVRARLAAVRASTEVPPLFETEIVRKDGTRVWVELGISSVFRNDQLVGRLGVARDISARRQAEEQLRLQSAALDAAANAMMITDRDGRISWVNPAFTRLTGYAAAEAIGQTPRLLKSGKHDASFYRDLWETILAGQVWSGLIVNRRKDGTLYTEEQTITPIQDAGGGITHFIAAKQDVTERERLQEQLIQSEKLASLGELIGGIAHELNNPLAVLMGHAQLLRMSPPDPKTAARAEKLHEAAQRAARIVRGFLTFARKHDPQQVAVSVNDVIRATLELLAYELRVGAVDVESSLAPRLPDVAGDPHQLQQAFLNLLSNARQAMASAHGRGTLRVTSALDQARGVITVTVSDDGPGILPEHLPRVWEPFFTTKPPGQGTGLGLAIARSIVSEHGGTIAVESGPGEGATFVVALPVSRVALVHAEPGAPAEAPRGLRILAVDDEVALRELVADALEGRGNRIETAADGQSALATLTRFEPDVLVLDLRMPGMSGLDLWQEIEQVNPALARRTVFCTGVVDAHERILLDRTGCPSLSKPFQWPDFYDAVARAAAR